MGDIAQLFPYRDASNRLMFRGKVGLGGVSKFYPVRIGSQMYLRGLNGSGKVVYGFPYRDTSGRLMGRTLYLPYGDPGCCYLPYSITATVSGGVLCEYGGGCSGGNFVSRMKYDLFNGNYTLTPSLCDNYGGAPHEEEGFHEDDYTDCTYPYFNSFLGRCTVGVYNLSGTGPYDRWRAEVKYLWYDPTYHAWFDAGTVNLRQPDSCSYSCKYPCEEGGYADMSSAYEFYSVSGMSLCQDELEGVNVSVSAE